MRLHELRKEPLTDFRGFLKNINANGYGTDLLDIEAYFSQRGFKMEGEGSFGIVMSHPKLDYVIKIFDMSDAGYINFVKHAKASRSKHFPVFIGSPKKVSKRWAAIRMEKLNRFNDYDVAKSMSYLNNYIRLYHEGRMSSQQVKDAMDSVKDDIPKSLMLAIFSLGKNQNERTADLRMDNIMQRDNGDIVITDPWVYYEGIIRDD